MSRKRKFSLGCLLPLLFIAFALGLWFWPSETPKREKVRSLFGQHPVSPEVGEAVYDEKSMLDANPYRPKMNSAESENKYKKFAKRAFRYRPRRRPIPIKKPSTTTASGQVVPSTTTAQAVAAALPPEQAAAVAPANVTSPTQSIVGEQNTPSAMQTSVQRQIPQAQATALSAQNPAEKAAQAPVGNATTQPMPNKEIMSLFPQMNNPKYQRQMKETDQLLSNLSKALEKAVAVPQQSKRMQNIAKYAKGGAGSSGRLGGSGRSSGGGSAASSAAMDAISAGGEAIAQNMEKNYGKKAADQVRQATRQYAQGVNQAMSIDNEEQRRAAVAAQQAAYEQQIRRIQIEEIFKQALKEHKEKYAQELTDAFGAESATAAAEILDKYEQDIFTASHNTEDPVEALMEVEDGFQKQLSTLLKEQHLESEDVDQRLQTVRSNVLTNNLESLTTQLEEQKAAGNKISMEVITDEYLEGLRAEREQINQNIINEVLNSEEMQKMSPAQKAAWQQQAQKILSDMTEEMITARKNIPPDQNEQYSAMIAQISDKATKALGQIELPLTQEEEDARNEMNEQNQAYLDYVSKMYGEKAGAEVRTLLLKLQRELITPEEFDAQQQAIFDANRSTFEANKEQAQRDREKEISKSCARYKNQILASKAVKQYPIDFQKIIKRMITQPISQMEEDLILLSREENLSEEDYNARATAISERTNKQVNDIIEYVRGSYLKTLER